MILWILRYLFQNFHCNCCNKVYFNRIITVKSEARSNVCVPMCKNIILKTEISIFFEALTKRVQSAEANYEIESVNSV